ncbi:MAG: hypothetical protein M1453_01000 [Acidobacteria bacterium]|nr:hypothetical protein [Acidobacteriota bacterium]MCL5286562.1 hypothetical protein [Acidobacteriota bacterium]
MNRPGGVTVSAALTVLVSLAAAFMGTALLLVDSFLPRYEPQQPFHEAIEVFSAVVFFGCALWGLITAVGLIRMRRWARICILLIAALLVFSGCFLLVMFLVATQLIPEFQSAEMVTVRIYLIATYLTAIALGLWWLIYFNRAGIKAAFLAGAPASVPLRPHLPLSIAVIAWHAIAFGLCTAVFVVTGSDPYIFGIVLTGWTATTTNLFLAATQLAIGIGLLKLKPWSHTAAVSFCLMAMAQALLGVFLSSQDIRILKMIQIFSFELNLDSTSLPRWTILVGPAIVWGTFGCALWYLITRKQAFLEAGEFAKVKA